MSSSPTDQMVKLSDGKTLLFSIVSRSRPVWTSHRPELCLRQSYDVSCDGVFFFSYQASNRHMLQVRPHQHHTTNWRSQPAVSGKSSWCNDLRSFGIKMQRYNDQFACRMCQRRKIKRDGARPECIMCISRKNVCYFDFDAPQNTIRYEDYELNCALHCLK